MTDWPAAVKERTEAYQRVQAAAKAVRVGRAGAGARYNAALARLAEAVAVETGARFAVTREDEDARADLFEGVVRDAEAKAESGTLDAEDKAVVAEAMLALAERAGEATEQLGRLFKAVRSLRITVLASEGACCADDAEQELEGLASLAEDVARRLGVDPEAGSARFLDPNR